MTFNSQLFSHLYYVRSQHVAYIYYNILTILCGLLQILFIESVGKINLAQIR